MSWMPLFPLEIALLPGGDLHLHIFETKYREMIGRCIRDSVSFGVVHQRDGSLAEIGCLATVVRVLHRYPDGRFDILARGSERIRLAGVREHESGYLEGEVEPVEEASEQGDHDLEDRVEEQYRRLASLSGDAECDLPPRGPRWSFRLAERIVLPVEVRQGLLELMSENARLLQLEEQLGLLISRRAEREKLQAVVRGNGRIRPAPPQLGAGSEAEKT